MLREGAAFMARRPCVFAAGVARCVSHIKESETAYIPGSIE